MTHFLSLHRVGVLAATLCAGIASSLYGQTITTFDMPNSTSTQPSAINAAGQITGSYSDALGQHGFLRQADGTSASFDAPYPFQTGGPPVQTGPTSIDAAGQITGYVFHPTDISFGFLRHTDGTFVVFGGDCFGVTAPEDVLTPVFEGTTPTAINERGQITGTCGPGAGISFGFLRQPDGAITVFEPAPAPVPHTRALAINSRGQITGVYLQENPTAIYRGFLREPDGTITTFDVNGLDTIPTALNSKGEIAGYTGNDGFLRQQDGGIELFDGPSSTSTQSTAINHKGQITGVYLDASNVSHGFLREKNGTITTIDVPNASNTYPTGINAKGEITGWYSDASGVHGFVRSR